MGRPTAGWGSINCAGAGQPGRVWQARTAPGVAMLPGEAGINVRKTARYASKDCDPLQDSSIPRARRFIGQSSKREVQTGVIVHVFDDEPESLLEIAQGRQGSPNKIELAVFASLLWSEPVFILWIENIECWQTALVEAAYFYSEVFKEDAHSR